MTNGLEPTMNQAQQGLAFRQLEIHWNGGLITASVAVSFLGAFTTTQMLCQARSSRYFSGVLVWTILGSLTFGFCSIWSLHFIAMLACELPLLVRLNVPLTVLSAILAVTFTFLAFAWVLMRDGYLRFFRKRKPRTIKRESRKEVAKNLTGSTEALLETRASVEFEPDEFTLTEHTNGSIRPSLAIDDSGASRTLGPSEDHFAGGMFPNDTSTESLHSPQRLLSQLNGTWKPPSSYDVNESSIVDESVGDTESHPRSSGDRERSRRSSSTSYSDGSSLNLPGFMSVKLPKSIASSTTNVLIGVVHVLYRGATWKNVAKGFTWSLANSSMHYVGIFALKIPKGHVTLQPMAVLLSEIISWIVCTLGCILIPHVEVDLSQQLIFSAVVAAGVAGMHFTGIWAVTFWSEADETTEQGYPPNLAVAVTSIAVLTCMLANGLLAHSATLDRNKLVEIVQTRRKLWAAIAQKEHAEAAAAARSEFIASASHEIRTPLHQLQGYSDLLSRTTLNDEGRLLLLAIQQATRSLSMITANVLDWSRLEKGEAIYRPTSLDLRKVCESILNILPGKDDEVNMELMIVVAPDVPQSLFLDEIYLQRILMNLLTNAMKFTQSGYVMLLIATKNDNLVVTIRDSGFGIPESFLPHLFEPFKQAQIRGAQRGNGLGLAIIRQLLQKIEGTITVESNCQQTENVGTEKCGSTFTVRIPASFPTSAEDSLGSLGSNGQLALLLNHNFRFAEGFQLAWKTYGFDLILPDLGDEIPDSWRYIWTDLTFLRAHTKLLHQIVKLRNQFVLVSYDSQALLEDSFGPIPLPHIIPVKRPFVWHRIVESLTLAVRTGRSSIGRSVRFAPLVDIVPNAAPRQPSETVPLYGPTVLLVEDNKINQRLGVKMLRMLGHNSIVADDGQDAIDKLVEHSQDIALILMDLSMPRMDGITATKRIREMEQSGLLPRTRCPIVMVTAEVGPDAQALCMSAGTDAFVPKPLALSKLENTLKKFLG
ncbi:hypothetical protein LTR84_001064 [Exophiala bonariae]|uniref:Histidine kinase n=1 Tax=Exophiala bonariae TaxID=1690606 RepID=A0AAV9NSC1_9EURO|nr:hypothetical protein LTR84_001064 [Exophiala bonariae]